MKSHRPPSQRRFRAAAVLAAVAMAATACSSSTKSSGSSTSTTSGGGGGSAETSNSSTVGVTATTITIGTTAPLTGPAAPGYSEIAPAANAVFKFINSQGGVYGRKINDIIVDDAYNPATTASKVREMVLQDHIFAEVGGLGTPTQSAVQGFLNTEKIPQLFVESGCDCWNDPKYPYSFGWQPPYTVEGKILGTYIKDHFANEKVGYLYQNDDFGQGFVQGLDDILPASQVVSKQTYDAATLSGPLSNQVAALKAAGAQVVALATIPAATALTLLPAAAVGYKPQWVVSSVGGDPPTVAPLLSSFSKGAAGASLLDGMISNAYIPPESDTSNPWVQVIKKLLDKYDPGAPLDGNTEYGVALGYTFVQALQKAGKDLTRGSLLKAIEEQGAQFSTPGLVPLSYSPTNHYGFEGSEVVQNHNGAYTAVSPVYKTGITGPVTQYSGSPSQPPAALSGV
ncbi:MAG TPA: ABC transporter substrate-binding protein [Acidimicrobiales bacterium]|nr:ABC transporter substrate-binding protein [Acidimicrobiales bacterium]